jgi:hypothetical protein
MGAWQWYQFEFMAAAERKPYNRAGARGNAPLLSPVGDVSPQESMSLDFRVASLPYKSSSFATPEGEICSLLNFWSHKHLKA